MREIINVNLPEAQRSQIERYLVLLQKWNQVFNLTAIHDPDKMWTHHVLDSLAVAPFFQSGRNYLDVGTGPGLPGLILAIVYPEKAFTLLDSNSKKTGFLLKVIQELALKNVVVVHARVQDWHPAGRFDAVVSRAFSSLENFVDLCGRFLNESGVLLAMKGPKVVEELANFDRPHQLEKLVVPGLDGERYMVLIQNGASQA